jgi:hypothetical protein
MFKQTDIIKRVPFNAHSKEHRNAVYKFIKSGKWDIYFEIPKNCQNLPYTLMEEVLFYFDKVDNAAIKA